MTKKVKCIKAPQIGNNDLVYHRTKITKDNVYLAFYDKRTHYYYINDDIGNVIPVTDEYF
jgi:hypothetical protein